MPIAIALAQLQPTTGAITANPQSFGAGSRVARLGRPPIVGVWLR